MAECIIPAFINNVPTIEPLPEFPIVCPVVFPPALAIPDIPTPPCIDGFDITSSGLAVNISMGDVGSAPQGSGEFTVTQGQCSFELGGSITLIIPSAGGGGGGGGGGVDGCPEAVDGTPQIRNEAGECVPVWGCSTPGKFDELTANRLMVECGADTSTAYIMADAGGLFAKNLGSYETSITGLGVLVSDDVDAATSGVRIAGVGIEVKLDFATAVGVTITDTTIDVLSGATAGTKIAADQITISNDYGILPGVVIDEESIRLDLVGGGFIYIQDQAGLIVDSTRGLQVREIDWCEPGSETPKKVLVLMSKPYDA